MVVPGLPDYLVENVASVVDFLFYHYDLLVLKRPYTGEIYTLDSLFVMFFGTFQVEFLVIGDPTT